MAIIVTRYSRNTRPPLAESLGEHTDREHRKIEIAIDGVLTRLKSIEARLTAASIP